MQTSEQSNFLRAEAELLLEQSRKAKAEKIKDLGEPIQLSGAALDIQVRGNFAWIAENTSVARKIDLETGKAVQVFRGHSAPVAALAFHNKVHESRDEKLLITGSWDKTINVWDTDTKQLISSTPAHSDFIKVLHVIPSLNLLISGSSDKIVRFWDLSNCQDGKPLPSMGSISDHTRPVETLEAYATSDSSAVVFTADTMGIVKVWDVTKEDGPAPRWKASLRDELKHHRTGVNDMYYGEGQLWTASSDESVQVVNYPTASVAATNPQKSTPPIYHPKPVKALLPLSLSPLAESILVTGNGDVIRTYDVSSLEEPELLGEVDGHWHDVLALRLWLRQRRSGDSDTVTVEPWIVSTSLDGTIRKWRLSELVNPTPTIVKKPEEIVEKPDPQDDAFGMTEEEERELAELMDSD